MGIPAKLKSHQPPIDSREIPKATVQWTAQRLASLAGVYPPKSGIDRREMELNAWS
jgi:hypothetical protein